MSSEEDEQRRAAARGKGGAREDGSDDGDDHERASPAPGSGVVDGDDSGPGEEDATDADGGVAPRGESRSDDPAPVEREDEDSAEPVVVEHVEPEGPAELFEFRLQICAHDAAGKLVAVHTKCERDDTFPSKNTVKVANNQRYVLVFQVANTRVPFDSLLAVRVGEYDVPITKQLRRDNEFVCEGLWDTADITPTGNGFRIQMPVRVAYLLVNEKYCRETEFILQMKVYDAKDARKAQQGGTPLDCISCRFYRTSSRSVKEPMFLRAPPSNAQG